MTIDTSLYCISLIEKLHETAGWGSTRAVRLPCLPCRRRLCGLIDHELSKIANDPTAYRPYQFYGPEEAYKFYMIFFIGKLKDPAYMMAFANQVGECCHEVITQFSEICHGKENP